MNNENTPAIGREMYLRLFTILNILGIISCFINIKLGIVSSLVILILVATHFDVSLFGSDVPFIIYLFFNLISFISYFWNGRPVSVFFAALSFNFIPALLYYLGKYIGEKQEGGAMIDHMLSAIVFMMTVGTVAYLLFPSFYYTYIGASVESYTYGLVEYRYGSFISSLAMGSIGTVSIIMYFYRMDSMPLLKRLFYLPMILLNVVICMQRSAWLVSCLSLFVCVLLKVGKEQKNRIRIFGMGVLMLFVVVLLFIMRSSIFTGTQLAYFSSRLSAITLGDMTSSRSDQWVAAWKTFLEYPVIGFGLGSCGQKAAAYGMAVVTDGNHMRILAEIGIFGFGAFIVMNVRTIRLTIRKNPYLALIIIACNLAAIGSPIFDQYYSSFAYWLILGLASSGQMSETAAELGDNYETV